jgi:DNA-binding MarR family transcriptional regulator
MTLSRRREIDEAARAAAEGTRCVALRARRLSRLVTRLFEEALRPHGITVAQFTLIGATILEGPLRPARLARLLDLEKSTLSRNLRLMEAAGLLRVEDADDGAGQRIHVTERGQRKLVRAFPAWREAQERAVRALGGAVVEKLDAMIAALGDDQPTPGKARRRRAADAPG